MSRILFGALVAAIISVPASAEAQNRWRFDLRGGVAFATEDLRDVSLGTGFGFEGTVNYRFQPHLWAYAGWDWHRFSAEDSFAGADGDIEETGYAFGLLFEHPLGGPASPALRLRAGGTYNHMEVENATGSLVADSDHGLGWEAGAGLAFRLDDRWQVAPGVRFRSLSQDLTVGSVTTAADLRYLDIGVGFSRSF